ncbi:LysR family transcriptional regulator [Mangrovicoccus algicola]|uniref:LysR family transcriptional regulator n=1 Tax=Mangrovicoccus algicola TaxID=2771008 RepID=A0A8J7CJ25_9RHOB|nr:LysR family transcriptional regulator [Mangrovicoccus algicola]MBE3640305.1 LysR family transcriptional regulator [Mangrovicoccus algicola]
MDLLDGLRAFVATAQGGSFTAAADRLGLSNRLTSKYVAALEDRLGVRLLQRTTRRVGITPAGERLLARAPALLEEVDALIADVAEDRGGLSGVIRVSAPVTFGEIFVRDLLGRFAALHPALIPDLRLDDAHSDLAAGGIDLAFRIGTPETAALTRHPLGWIGTRLVAAPAYLARHGTPRTPRDLPRHRCLLDTNRRLPDRWRLDGPQGPEEIRVPGHLLANSARVIRDLAIAGHGVALLPDFVLPAALESGDLVALCPGYRGETLPVAAVWLEGRRLPRKVRALVDFAHEDFARTLPR